MNDIVERLKIPVMLHSSPEQTNAERREALAEIERLTVLVELTLWQPIEAAPKDGTNILARGWREGKPIVRVTWWRQPKDAKGYIGWGEFNEHFWPPTHWMPIPAFPSDERA